jgi:hypothetical protein
MHGAQLILALRTAASLDAARGCGRLSFAVIDLARRPIAARPELDDFSVIGHYSIPQPAGALDEHHAHLVRRAGARTEPREHEHFEPLAFAFQCFEEVCWA